MKADCQSSAGDDHLAGKRTPSAADDHVSHRIRTRRIEVGLSQEQLGIRLGLSAQQIQKYECAISRIAVGRLYELARALDCQPQYFFEGLGSAGEAVRSRGDQVGEDCRQKLLPWGFVAVRAGSAHISVGDRVRTAKSSRFRGREFVVVEVNRGKRPNTISIRGAPILDDGNPSRDIVWIGPATIVDVIIPSRRGSRI